MQEREVYRDRVCLITGAASGIGLALSEALLEAGATVVLADRDGKLLDEAAGRLAPHAGRTRFVSADVTAPAQIQGAIREAASDLGARNLTRFWQITVPLSKNGIIAGCMLVFIPVVGEFVIPEMLGGPETLMIGKVLWQEFFNNRDWPVASALAVVMLAVLIVPIILFNRNQAKELEGKA